MLWETAEPQRLSPMTANSPIALRARCGGRGTMPIETPGPLGIPRAASPIETSLSFFIPFLGRTPIHPGAQRPQVQGKERECRYRNLILRCFPQRLVCSRVRTRGRASRGMIANVGVRVKPQLRDEAADITPRGYLSGGISRIPGRFGIMIRIPASIRE